MGRKRGDPAQVRKKEARFVANDGEQERIKEAAKFKRLKPATYMRRLVLSQVERDLADRDAQRAAETAVPAAPDAAPVGVGAALRQVAEMLASIGEKLERAENN